MDRDTKGVEIYQSCSILNPIRPRPYRSATTYIALHHHPTDSIIVLPGGIVCSFLM